MVKMYLLVLGSQFVKDDVTSYLNEVPKIKFWLSTLPSAIFIKSELSSKQLSEIVTTKFGDYLHFITETSDNYWGMLDASSWESFTPPHINQELT